MIVFAVARLTLRLLSIFALRALSAVIPFGHEVGHLEHHRPVV